MMRIFFLLVVVSFSLINCLQSDDTSINATPNTAIYDTGGNQTTFEEAINYSSEPSFQHPYNYDQDQLSTIFKEDETTKSIDVDTEYDEIKFSSTIENTSTTTSIEKTLDKVTPTKSSHKLSPEYNESENDLESTFNNTCSKCINKSPKIRNFNSSFTTNKMELSWDSLNETLNECKFQFTINDTSTHKRFPYFRREEHNYHVIENINQCDKFNFIVEANNKCGFQDTLTTTLYSEPVEVQDLNIDVANGFTNISWSHAVNAFCRTYQIHLNGSTYNTDQNFYMVPANLFCVDIGIQTIREDNETGPITHASGTVQNLKIDNSKEGVLHITWDAPEEQVCVDHYEIGLKLNDSSVTLNVTTTQSTEAYYDNLESCTEYVISIEAMSGKHKGHSLMEVIKTKIPETINRVKNAKLYYNTNTNKLIAHWNIPEHQESCITSYKLIQWGNEKSSTYETDKNEFSFPSAIGCAEYKVNISAQISKEKESAVDILTIKIPHLEPRSPTCAVERIGKTTALFNCSIETYAENMCDIVSIQTICTDGYNNQTVDQVISSHKSRGNIEVSVSGLSEYTNYSCKVNLKNNKGFSKPSKPLNFLTNEGAPSKPENFTINDINGTYFELLWQPPSKVRGILQSYQLVIEPSPKHNIPEGCVEKPVREEYVLEPNIQKYTYQNALPHFKYKCIIRAKTIDFSEVTEIAITTNTDVPEPPRNFTIQFVNYSEDHYNVSLVLKWLAPCNSNGNIKHFLITLVGDQLDRSIISDEREFRVSANPILNEYIKIILKIKVLHTYNVSISTVLDNDEASEPVIINFVSPYKYASAPEIISINSTSLNSITIYWNEPKEVNAIRWRYLITVACIKPLHEMVPYCGDYGCGIKTIKVPQDQLSYEYDQMRPNYEYKIHMLADTLYEYGDTSEEKLFRTGRTQSDAVGMLTSNINHIFSLEYNATLIVNFETPCNLNGELLFYEILLSGVNEIFEKPTFKYISTCDLGYEIALNASYNYTLEVTVVTNCRNEDNLSMGALEDDICRSETIQKYHISPSGVPVETDNFTEVINMDKVYTDKVVLSLTNDIFGTDYGQIHYYAIILNSLDNYDETEENYGEWLFNKWPKLGSWSNNTEKVHQYQASPKYWNPFNETDDIEYILGTENCSDGQPYCNGPLRPDTMYVMEIRGFTKNAFRDTKVISFKTLQLEDLEKANTVVKIVIIIVIVTTVLILLFGIAYYYFRRKSLKRITEVIEEAGIQIPVPVLDFPHYYTEVAVKQVDILKNEFAVINSRSAEEALPTVEALLPENRKKNRYINILPYDYTRVVLKEGISDYINASYIKGYSEDIEYIASQGPLESTYADFWRMVLEEKVTVVVMVAQFTEQKKEKCYKYIPEVHEQIEIDDIKIRCAVKLDFSSHSERHIKIQQDGERHEIIHLQFLNWPDFGCPTGTENMLHFCRIMRSRIEQDPGKIVVHCSAGVGRTGTLIALDILLQTIDADRGIDVFNTVLNLRKQRKNMVQTESQYLYIYNCIHDALTNPKILEDLQISEPIYENIIDIEMKVLNSNNNENIENDN